MEERNYRIDFFRGIAAISIIMHHVASYSGVVYSPYAIIPLTMLVDVPAFLFISGWTFHYNRNFKTYLYRLTKLIFFSVFFSLFYVLFIEVFDFFHKEEAVDLSVVIHLWIRQSLFQGELHDIFSVVNASLWFMPLYLKVYALFGALLLALSGLIKKEPCRTIAGWLITACLFGIFCYLQQGKSIPGIQREMVFYGFFFLLGYFGCKIPASFRKFYPFLGLLTAASLVWMEFFTEKKLEGMQFNKFPPNLMFGSYSMLFLYVVLFFKEANVGKNSPVAWIGRNALYFFWGQGFGVSILNQVDDYVHLFWPVKYALSCVAGFLLTFCFALFLKLFIGGSWKWINQKFVKNSSQNKHK